MNARYIFSINLKVHVVELSNNAENTIFKYYAIETNDFHVNYMNMYYPLLVFNLCKSCTRAL